MSTVLAPRRGRPRGIPQRRRPTPDWFDYVTVGDVLLINGTYRIVRGVSRVTDGRRGRRVGALHAVTFAIRRRSWTNRPLTVYMASDLLTARARYVGVRVKLESELDALLAHETAWPFNGDRKLFARDVVGRVPA